MDLLPHLEFTTGADPIGTVIWMHGLGDSGWGHLTVVNALGQALPAPIRCILPHAPVRSVTINNGAQMPAWYDIAMNDIARLPDEGGIRQSQAAVQQLIAREGDRGVDPDHIVVAGFSQGAAIALQVGLRHPERLAGVVALSGYLTLEDSLAREGSAANKATPILMCHGTRDPVVPLQLAQQSRATLERLGYQVAWEDYPMEHQLCGEEVEVIAEFLLQVLGGAPAAPARSSILLP